MQVLDFRSDTLTKPDAAMRRAMYEAEVGDDYYGEDPTVRGLEEYAAEILGKEAALFVLSGTMGNAVAIRAQVPHGSGAIVGYSSHIYRNEGGQLAAISGLTPFALLAPNGRFALPELEEELSKSKRRSVLSPDLRLICVENTHNAEGGRCLDVAHLSALRGLIGDRSIVLHMDGARLFNAAVALNETPARLAAPMDSVTFCLSKGLGAPAGAILAGSRAFVEEARCWRQTLGGGMRQAGIIAAAGLHALKHRVARLSEDHENARRLATGLSEAGLTIDLASVETNIVMAHVPAAAMSAPDFHRAMADMGVLTLAPKGTRLRFVTYDGVTASDVSDAAGRIASLMRPRVAGVA